MTDTLIGHGTSWADLAEVVQEVEAEVQEVLEVEQGGK